MTEMAEFGSVGNVGFLDPENVKMYGEDGNEIKIPKCEKCGVHKCQVIGKNAFAWICINDCDFIDKCEN